MAGLPKADAGLFAWAAFYLGLGCSVIPLREGKLPAVQWKQFQARLPSRSELGKWFIDAGWGMALVCGKVSGNLVRLDFDDPNDYSSGVCAKLPYPTFRSQRKDGGYGVLLRSTVPVPTLPQKTFDRYPKLEVRGEGSITVVPPTPGYEWLEANPIEGIPEADVPSILKRLFGFDLSNRRKLADSVEQTAGSELATLLRETAVGERSNSLVRIAGMLRARGLDLETALVVMEHNFAEHWSADDMPWKQAKETFEQAWRRYEHEGVRFTDKPNLAEGDGELVAMRIDQVPKPAKDNVLIDRFVLAGEAGNTLIAAPAKMGKTSLLLDAAVTASRGDPVWGALKVARPLKIAFIDQERKFDQIVENLELMEPAIGKPRAENLWLLVQKTGQFEVANTQTLDQLYGWLSGYGPDLVVLDGWGWFVGHMASDPKEVRPAMSWLKRLRQELGCATVIIHHFKKAQFAGRSTAPEHSEVVDALDQIEGLKRLVDQAQTALVYVPIPGYDTFNLLDGRTNKPAWDPPKLVLDYDHTTITHKVVSAAEGVDLFDPDTYRRLWAATAESRLLKGEINVICNRMGWDFAALARELGVDRAQVSRWYSGQRNPSGDNLRRLSELYAKAKKVPLKAARMPKPAGGSVMSSGLPIKGK